jgi:hypothetical protein
MKTKTVKEVYASLKSTRDALVSYLWDKVKEPKKHHRIKARKLRDECETLVLTIETMLEGK